MSRRNEVTVGLVIVLGIAVIVFGTLFMKGKRLGSEEETLRARFREVGLLSKGNAVMMRGVPVGKVESIELEPGGDGVMVEMSVKANLPLPKDPVVLLSPKSMFGDWQAEIFPRSAFPQYQYAESPDRSVLPGATLPDITRLTAVADEIARNLAVLTNRFGMAFTEETATNIRDAIDNIQEVSGKLTALVDAQQKTLDEVASNLQTTSRSLGEAATTARDLFAQIDTAVAQGQLRSTLASAHATSMHLDSISRSLLTASQELKSTMSKADTAFTAMAGVAGAMQRGEGTLGLLLRDSTLYRQLVQTNEQLQVLLADLQKNPRKYINLHIF